MEEKYLKIRKIVEKELSSSAHGMDHVMRVYNLSLSLSKEEADIDLDILIPAVLLHDIARVNYPYLKERASLFIDNTC